MIKIIKSQEYFEDLIMIDNFISSDLENPAFAFKTINEIEDSVAKLNEFPEMGIVFSYGPIHDTGFRYLIHDEYIIFYKLVDDEVHIDRVFNTRTNYLKKLLAYIGLS